MTVQQMIDSIPLTVFHLDDPGHLVEGGVIPDAPLLDKAKAQGITLLGTDLPVYDCAVRLGRLLEP